MGCWRRNEVIKGEEEGVLLGDDSTGIAVVKDVVRSMVMEEEAK